MRISMAKESDVGGRCLVRWISTHSVEHTPLRCYPQDSMMREVNPAEEINARSERFDENFIGMERDTQSYFEEIRYCRQKNFQILPVLVHNHKIIGVTDAIANLQFPIQKLIELIHINVHEELACEIAERQTDAGLVLSMETINDFA